MIMYTEIPIHYYIELTHLAWESSTAGTHRRHRYRLEIILYGGHDGVLVSVAESETGKSVVPSDRSCHHVSVWHFRYSQKAMMSREDSHENNDIMTRVSTCQSDIFDTHHIYEWCFWREDCSRQLFSSLLCNHTALEIDRRLSIEVLHVCV